MIRVLVAIEFALCRLFAVISTIPYALYLIIECILRMRVYKPWKESAQITNLSWCLAWLVVVVCLVVIAWFIALIE